jgi:ABC-type branched-subunit amino acid transport system substrate-binding protein
MAVSACIALVALAGCKGNSSKPSTGGGGSASSGAPQTGLTSNSITLGTMADLTGPVPGIFQGAVDGAQAYAAYINSQGGVNGRQFKVVSKDSALSCSLDTQGITSMASSTFASVGSFALYDSCSIPVLQKNPNYPYVGVELNSQLAGLSNVFSPQPIPAGFRTGAFKYIMSKYGVKRMGFLSGQGAQEPVEKNQYEAAKSAGATIAYVRFIAPTETDFTSDVIRMRKANVDWVDIGTLTAADAAHFIQDAQQQNWHPKVIEAATTYDGKFFGYFPKPSVANGVIIDQTYSMFLGEDSSLVPAVKTFNTWMKKANPSFKPDLYAMYGWTSMALFAQALKAAGQNPTQASVIAALKNIHTFNADGILAPDNPGAKKPATCWMMSQVENSTFKRIYPSKGFACSPGGFYYAK